MNQGNDLTEMQYEAVAESMSVINQCRNTVASIFDEFGRLVMNVDARAQGRGVDAFVREYESLKPKFAEFDQRIEKFRQNLNMSQEMLQDMDAKLAARAEAELEANINVQ